MHPGWAEANVMIGFFFFYCKHIFSSEDEFGRVDNFYVSKSGFLTPLLYVRLVFGVASVKPYPINF